MVAWVMSWFAACEPVAQAPPTPSPTARERFDPAAASGRPPAQAPPLSARVDDAPRSDWGPPLTAETRIRTSDTTLVALEGGRWGLVIRGIDPGAHVFDPAEGRIATVGHPGTFTPDGAWLLPEVRRGHRLPPHRRDGLRHRVPGVDRHGVRSLRISATERVVWSDAMVATVPDAADGRVSSQVRLPAGLDPRGRVGVEAATELGAAPAVQLVSFRAPDSPPIVLDGCLSVDQVSWSADGTHVGCITVGGFTAFRSRGGAVEATWIAEARALSPVGASWSADGSQVVLVGSEGDVAHWVPATDAVWTTRLAPGTQAILTDDGTLVVASLAGASAIFDARDGTRLDDPDRPVAWADPEPGRLRGIDGTRWTNPHPRSTEVSAVDGGCDVQPGMVQFAAPSIEVESVFWIGDVLHAGGEGSMLSWQPGGDWHRIDPICRSTPPATLTPRRRRWVLTVDGRRQRIGRTLPDLEVGATDATGAVLSVAGSDAWWLARGDEPLRALGGGARWIAIDPAGTRVAGVTARGELRVIDVADPAEDVVSLRHPRLTLLTDLAWSDDGRWLAAARSDGVLVFDAAGGLVSRFEHPRRSALVVDPDGCLVAWTALDDVWVWDGRTGRATAISPRLDGHRELRVAGGVVEVKNQSGRRLRWTRERTVAEAFPWSLQPKSLVVADDGAALVHHDSVAWATSSDGAAWRHHPAPDPPPLRTEAGGRTVRPGEHAVLVHDARSGAIRCVLPGGRIAALSATGRTVAWIQNPSGFPAVADVDRCALTRPIPQVAEPALAAPRPVPVPLRCGAWGCALGRSEATGTLLSGREPRIVAQSADGGWAILGSPPTLWQTDPAVPGPTLPKAADRPVVRHDGVTAWRQDGALWWTDPTDGILHRVTGLPAPDALAWHPTSGLLLALTSGALHRLSLDELRERAE